METMQADLNEVVRLINLTERANIRQFLLDKKTELEQKMAEANKTLNRKTETNYTVIKNFSWDQTSKFVKLYVTVPKVSQLELSHVKSTFACKSMDILVESPEVKESFQFRFNTLCEKIVPEKSYCKVYGGNNMTVYLAKEKENTWECVSEARKKAEPTMSKKEKETANDAKDPMGSLMGMMKKMYDEGDDEMKRTIGKAMSEARDKQGGGMPPLF